MDDRERVERAIENSRRALDDLPPSASFRSRVLLQMLLIELEKERARRCGKDPGEPAPDA